MKIISWLVICLRFKWEVCREKKVFISRDGIWVKDIWDSLEATRRYVYMEVYTNVRNDYVLWCAFNRRTQEWNSVGILRTGVMLVPGAITFTWWWRKYQSRMYDMWNTFIKLTSVCAMVQMEGTAKSLLMDAIDFWY